MTRQDAPGYMTLSDYCGQHGIRLKTKYVLPAKQAINRMVAASPYRALRVHDGDRDHAMYPITILDEWRKSRASYRPTFADIAPIVAKAEARVATAPPRSAFLDPPFEPGHFPYRNPLRP